MKKYLFIILLFGVGFLLFFSCSNDTQKREDYKISLIDLEEITLNPDSLFTHISFNYNVLYPSF